MTLQYGGFAVTQVGGFWPFKSKGNPTIVPFELLGMYSQLANQA